MRYAQINKEGICFADSFLAEEFIADNMILLSENEPSPLGKKYQNGVWQEIEQTEEQYYVDEAQQERQLLAQQITDLELAILEGGK